jgi:hypothetical protein
MSTRRPAKHRWDQIGKRFARARASFCDERAAFSKCASDRAGQLTLPGAGLETVERRRERASGRVEHAGHACD